MLLAAFGFAGAVLCAVALRAEMAPTNTPAVIRARARFILPPGYDRINARYWAHPSSERAIVMPGVCTREGEARSHESAGNPMMRPPSAGQFVVMGHNVTDAAAEEVPNAGSCG